MLVPLAVLHMDLALRDSVNVEVIGQARTAVTSWSLPMVMRRMTWRLTSASTTAPKEELALLVCASAKRVGQESHAMWQPNAKRTATILQVPAQLGRASVRLASLGQPVLTSTVRVIVSVMAAVFQAPAIVRRAGQVAPVRTK